MFTVFCPPLPSPPLPFHTHTHTHTMQCIKDWKPSIQNGRGRCISQRVQTDIHLPYQIMCTVCIVVHQPVKRRGTNISYIGGLSILLLPIYHLNYLALELFMYIYQPQQVKWCKQCKYVLWIYIMVNHMTVINGLVYCTHQGTLVDSRTWSHNMGHFRAHGLRDATELV